MSEKLGDVMHLSKNSRTLIIHLETETRIGEWVFDKKGKKVGEVFDIFGPVDNPYAAIKLGKDVQDPKIKTVFLGDKRPQKKRRYRR